MYIGTEPAQCKWLQVNIHTRNIDRCTIRHIRKGGSTGVFPRGFCVLKLKAAYYPCVLCELRVGDSHTNEHDMGISRTHSRTSFQAIRVQGARNISYLTRTGSDPTELALNIQAILSRILSFQLKQVPFYSLFL